MDRNYWYEDENEYEDEREGGGATKVLLIILCVLLAVAIMVVGGYFFLTKMNRETNVQFPGDTTKVIVEMNEESIMIYDEPFVDAIKDTLEENNPNTKIDCNVTIEKGWQGSSRLDDSDLKDDEVAFTYTVLMYYEEENDTEIIKIFMAYNPEKDTMTPKGVYAKEGDAPAYETYDPEEIQELFAEIY